MVLEVPHAWTHVEKNRGPEPAGRGCPQPDFLVPSGVPCGSLCTPMSQGHGVALKDRGTASPLFSPAPRTSSATRRTELSSEGRSALGTSQRTKYSRWGPPARGL